MQSKVERIEREFDAALRAAGDDERAVDAVRVQFLGRKGSLTSLMGEMRELSPVDKKAAGKAINLLKRKVEAAIETALTAARDGEQQRRIEAEFRDASLPPRPTVDGTLHPVTQTRRELETVFRELGFSVEDGPEVEDDFHNFQALNMPPDHPATESPE